MVVGNTRAQVVDMMKPDVAGEPLQDSWQLIKGTALKRRCGVIPVLGPRPIGALELMLHVEQPQADGAGKRRYGELNQSEMPSGR